MLKKKNRLKKYSAIIATYKNNDKLSDENISMYFGKIKQDVSQDTKVAFIVSKKIHKRAVKRNKIKRLMREAFKLIFYNPDYSFLNNYLSVVCKAEPNSLNKDFQTIFNSFSNLIKKKTL